MSRLSLHLCVCVCLCEVVDSLPAVYVQYVGCTACHLSNINEPVFRSDGANLFILLSFQCLVGNLHRGRVVM